VATRPELDPDLYTDTAITDPYPLYRVIRHLGPAVWMVRRVRRIEVGEPVLAVNNVLRGYGGFHVSFR
jgi:hypothetical protein